jgi:antitoxin component YwqK of YwqJK toxin-antitoxin module
MNTKILFLAFSVLLLFSCGKRLIDVENKNDAGQVIEKYFLDKDSLKFGLYTSFDELGNIFEESNYKKGQLQGVRTIYYPTGIVEIKENYKDGEFHGTYQSFYENGQLNLIAEYVNNKMEGIVKRYYSSGEIMEEIQFLNNEENGPFKEYYKNGQVKWEGDYINGDNEVGIVNGYDETGQLIKKMDCGKYKGEYICQTIWTLGEGEKELVLKYEE